MATYSNVDIEKFGDLKAQNAAGHNLRQIPSENVNSSKTHLNKFYVGDPKMDFNKELAGKLSRFPKIRKNAVKSVNLVFSASPELFKDKAKAQAWEKQTFDFIKEKFGLENIVYCVVHKDEKTPHFQVSVVPVDPKGKLNASHFFDGRKKCADFATEYNNAVKNLGLKRDKGKDKAKPQTTQEFYRMANDMEKFNKRIDQVLKNLEKKTAESSLLGVMKTSTALELFKPLLDIIKRYKAQYMKDQKKLEEREKLEQELTRSQMILEKLGAEKLDLRYVLNNSEKMEEIKTHIHEALTAKAVNGASAPLETKKEVLETPKPSIYSPVKLKPR